MPNINFISLVHVVPVDVVNLWSDSQGCKQLIDIIEIENMNVVTISNPS
jgi:hypothetical protein